MSEITSHHLHNIYTPRGAQVRDALAWSNYINESLELFGDFVEVQFASHHWPIWGSAKVVEYLKQQRDLYKYIHDQTLRLANHGFTKEEIAEQLVLPESLAKNFSNRDYYGTVSHNVKAVYVKYLGYFDGNPATLNPLPPVQTAVRYIEYMGGTEAVIHRARSSFKEGDYRWVAEIMNHVVMASPESVQARALLADTYEQMGYQSESGPWRNIYLTGALELRSGSYNKVPERIGRKIIENMSIENVFQMMAVRINGSKAAEKRFCINLDFTDLKCPYLMIVENAVLNVFRNKRKPDPDFSISLTSQTFKYMITGLMTVEVLLSSQELSIEGEHSCLEEFMSLLDEFDQFFPIVTPRTG